MEIEPNDVGCLKADQVLCLKRLWQEVVSFRDIFLQLLVLLAVLFAVSFAKAENRCSSLWLDQQKVTYGQADRAFEIQGNRLQLLVWNIHKASDPLLAEEFKFMSKYSDVVLFQESISDRKYIADITQANPVFGWSQAKAYEKDPGRYAGVATGSRITPIDDVPILSKVTEPFLHSPKSFMLSEYRIEGKQETLLVANMHAINFVTNGTFEAHVDQLVAHIRNHEGPLIVAGDFNTWNPGRSSYLDRMMANLGVFEVLTPQAGLLRLDHIYTRGLTTTGVHDMTFVKASDHSPLLVDFVIP